MAKMPDKSVTSNFHISNLIYPLVVVVYINLFNRDYCGCDLLMANFTKSIFIHALKS